VTLQEIDDADTHTLKLDHARTEQFKAVRHVLDTLHLLPSSKLAWEKNKNLKPSQFAQNLLDEAQEVCDEVNEHSIMLGAEGGRDNKALQDIIELRDALEKIGPNDVISAKLAQQLEAQISKVFNDVADTKFSAQEILTKNPDKIMGLMDSERDELKCLKEMMKQVHSARKRAENMPKITDGIEILKWLIKNYELKDPKVALTKKEVEALEEKLTLVVRDFGPELEEHKLLAKG
jgi:archaellum component FlaC